ncbi:MAG: DUF2116 family Zn-ribbon domain-containing protein [Candidatus Methanoplasma sp.]|jgi:predicted nucleic acid-binding Zn ribbon protein|nr:DUF2116 family Zn-ribbon domain-containing protein [Candidatus Methanoplasma sp.]
MSVRLPEHDHCKFCGDPVPFEQAYCSEDCYWNDQAKNRKEKRNNIIFVALTAASVAAIAIAGILL